MISIQEETTTKTNTKTKELGQVFTPKWIVQTIIQELNLTNDLYNKKVIDPACGDGAFLTEIVKIICENYPKKQAQQILNNNIYGIEIDKSAFNDCLKNLNNLTKNYDLKIKWNIFNDDTLILYKKYLNFFDVVIGNPPYIRIHNIDENTRKILKKEFLYNSGTIDLYLSFFELGFKLLNKNGKLGYITPNSFLRNTSYKNFRSFIKESQKLTTLIDFKANKVFEGFSTYTAISIFDSIEYKSFKYKELVDDKITTINNIEFKNLSDNFSFDSPERINFVRKIEKNTNKKISDFYSVQYGFATLRDKIFISKITKIGNDFVVFNGEKIETGLLKNIVKGSTFTGGKEQIKKIIFPYEKIDNKFIALNEEVLQNKYPLTYNYLLKNKAELLKRDLDKNALWYEFGRSQGVQTSSKNKIVVSTLMKDKIKFFALDSDTFVYSGIFITAKNNDFKIVNNVLNSNDFKKYIKITGKDFSGGYKSISSKQIKNFPTNIKQEQYSLFNI
jgi:adenine-specific DNA-methyltransferase